MMREKGVVVQLADGVATVAMAASAHAQCKSCRSCRPAEGGTRMLMDVSAPDGLKVGDGVVVEIPGPGAGMSAAILLLAPVVFFMAGLGLAEWLRARGALPGGTGVSVLIGLGLMCACYALAAAYDRRLRNAPEYRPRIVSANGPNSSGATSRRPSAWTSSDVKDGS